MLISRVLLVEDDDGIAELLRDFLEDEPGTAIIHAPTGRQAIECLRSQPHFIGSLIDVTLPEADGFAVASEAAACGVPALLMTGDFAHAETCEVNGFYYLMKPFGLEALRERLALLISEKDKHIEFMRAACLRLRETRAESRSLVEQSKRLIAEATEIGKQVEKGATRR